MIVTCDHITPERDTISSLKYIQHTCQDKIQNKSYYVDKNHKIQAENSLTLASLASVSFRYFNFEWLLLNVVDLLAVVSMLVGKPIILVGLCIILFRYEAGEVPKS